MAVQPAFRAETLRAAIRCAAHVVEDELAAGALGPAEEEHLVACARCRAAARVVRRVVLAEAPIMIP